MRLTAVVGCCGLLLGFLAAVPRQSRARPPVDGREVFQRVFDPATGLGPLFNNVSCVGCHDVGGVGGAGFEDDDVETHAAVFHGPDASAGTTAPGPAPPCDELTDAGGPVFRHQALPATPLPGVAPSARLGVTQVFTPPLFGLGLLDAVPDAVLETLEAQQHQPVGRYAAAGVAGRLHRLADGRIGRFGRKATVATLQEFTEQAFRTELGVEPGAELSPDDVAATTAFVASLPLPSRLDLGSPESLIGAFWFAVVGCDLCHQPQLEPGGPLLYTDGLLHDMGPTDAGSCRGAGEPRPATPTEFRTAPLIGLRAFQRFFHDGRARTLREAVVIHGGEADRVTDRFRGLQPAAQAALITFLEGL